MSKLVIQRGHFKTIDCTFKFKKNIFRCRKKKKKLNIMASPHKKKRLRIIEINKNPHRLLDLNEGKAKKY